MSCGCFCFSCKFVSAMNNLLPFVYPPFSESSPMFPVAQDLHSLVKSRKSQTRDLFTKEINISMDQEYSALTSKELPNLYTGTQSSLRISHQVWSDKYRLRCHNPVLGHRLKNINFGDRYTKKISARGSSKIMESAEYVGLKKGGFKTFLTLTLDKEARNRIDTRLPSKKLKVFPAGNYKRTELKKWCHHLERSKEIIKEFGIPVELAGAWCPVKYVKIDEYYIKECGPFIEYDYHWQSSIQKEVSRFMDSIKKMHKRGWIPKYTTGKEKLTLSGAQYTPICFNTGREYKESTDKNDQDFCYIWVAEAPENIKNEKNTHIHVLLNWSVLPSVFQAWAHRLEAIWGQGFANLERIKSTAAAGSYILKAAGYISSSKNKGDQGVIRGNRYAISKCARAPEWVCISSFCWGGIGHLINLTRQSIADKIWPLHQEKAEVKEKMQFATVNKTNDFHKLKNEMLSINVAIAEIPINVGRFSMVIKSKEILDLFLEWCVSSGWNFKKKESAFYLGEAVKRMKERNFYKSAPKKIWFGCQNYMSLLKLHDSLGESYYDQFEQKWEVSR